MNNIKMAGLLQQAANYSSYGVKTKYLSFDGVDDMVNCGTNASLNLQSITVEAWIKTSHTWTQSGDTISNAGIVCKSVAVDGERCFLFALSSTLTSNGTAGFRVRVSKDGTFTSTTEKQYRSANQIVQNGQWRHLAFTFGSDVLKLYLDGSELTGSDLLKAADASFTNMHQNLGTPVELGFTGSSFFPGFMDEVRIWDHARTEEQIKRHMNTKLTGWETGLVARYSMDKGSGTDLPDDQKDGLNNGTITGATWVTL